MTASATRTAPIGVVEAARAIRPVLNEHRSWADEHARMAPAALDAARDAGVFTLFAPREAVGTEATLPEIMAVFEEIGYADPTVAWHAGNSSSVCILAAHLSDAERERIFAEPRGPYGLSVVAGGAVARPVEGGYLLTGRWPFVTGCLDAPWASLGGVVHEDGAPRLYSGGPEARSFIVPQSDFVVEHTWESASAMRGTGSHAVTVQDVFVPEGMSRRLAAPRRTDRALYRLPALVAAPVTNCAIGLGITRRALEDATALVATKVSRFNGAVYRDMLTMQYTVARAQAEVDMLSAGLAAMSAEVWRHAEVGPLPERVRGHMWSTAYVTFDRTRAILSDLLTVSTSAVYSGRNPIETGLRDLHAICAAMEPTRDVQAAYGRVLLGMEPGNALF